MNSTFHQKKVSVIIPTFNRAKFLPNAVKSVISQNHGNMEIIIVDDGSDDDTQTVVNTLREECSNIIYCHNERLKGPSGARNTGIIKASGDYLSFLDSDDIWLSCHLMGGLEILNENSDIDVLFGNFSIVDLISGKHRYDFFDKKKILHTLKSVQVSPSLKILKDNLFIALIQENFFHLGSSIIRKSSAKGMLMDESVFFAEDRDYAINLFKQANATFAFRQDPVFILYRHDSNIYNAVNSNNWQRIAEIHIYLFTKYLRNFNLSDDEKRVLNKLIAKRLSNLSYFYGKNKKYQNALSCILKSFKYGVTLRQPIDLMKIPLTLLIPNLYKQ